MVMAAQAEVGLVLRHLHGLAVEQEQLSDRQLLEHFLGTREGEAFAALVRRHGGMVLGVCRRLLGQPQDAEDCFQATFFILARKAASIRTQESLGGWLYRVACHLALKARASAARRRNRESQGIPMTPADPTAQVTATELRILMDEELQQLPDKYRVPVVLCHLEGRTQEEAARQLGWSKGTLRRRLGQGRELLRRRLVRRGLAPAVALATTLTGDAAPAAVPAELIGTTARAALCFAAGTPAAAGAERAAALAEGGLTTMFFNKLKGLTALLLLTASLAAGAGLLAHQALTAREPARQAPTADKDKPVRTVEVSGRVLDPAGKPVAGAKLYFDPAREELRGAPALSRVWATSDADGRFRMRIPRAVFQAVDLNRRLHGMVVAAVPGHGPAWSALWQDGPQTKDLTLNLVHDGPLTGRLLDLQGKPLAGVTVRVVALAGLPRDALRRPGRRGDRGRPLTREALKEWAEAFADRQARGVRLIALTPVGAGLPAPVTTDRAGRFRLTGLGQRRLVALRFEGPDIETCDVAALARLGPTLRVPRNKDRRALGSYVFYGDGFDHVLPPGRPVSGTVRDKDSGKPLAGIAVQTTLPGAWPTMDRNVLSAVTDAQGRYQLPGLSRGDSHVIRALPAPGQSYLGNAARIRGPGTEAVRLDFALKRGVVVRGRVTDKATGKPVRATVSYFTFFDNPNLKGAMGFSFGRQYEALCAEDGSFELVALPGQGLLAARAPRELSGAYVAGAGAEKIKGAGPRGVLQTFPARILPLTYNTLVEIDPDRDATSFRGDIALDPGKTVSGTVVSPDGKPVEGVHIHATWGMGPRAEPQPARFTLKSINPANPQPFFFYHYEKKLGAAVLPRGDEPKDYTVRLQRMGTLTGRVLDEDGQPVAGAEMVGAIEGGQLNLPANSVSIFSFRVRTDQQGRFRADSILAGVKYRGSILGRRAGGICFEHATVKPGEAKDLGDIKLKARP
jgi:RNA polymerase sigma factor (sigma-70 family)